MKTAFKKYDGNGDGSIDRGELNKALTNYKLNFSDQVYLSRSAHKLQTKLLRPGLSI